MQSLLFILSHFILLFSRIGTLVLQIGQGQRRQNVDKEANAGPCFRSCWGKPCSVCAGVNPAVSALG